MFFRLYIIKESKSILLFIELWAGSAILTIQETFKHIIENIL